MRTIGEARLAHSAAISAARELGARLAAAVEARGSCGESPSALLCELRRSCAEVAVLGAQIAHSQAAGRLPGGESPAELLARLRALALERSALRLAAAAQWRASASASARRPARALDSAALERRLAELAAEQVELRARLEEHNWTTALIG
ncbi:MAG TPA: hypothetical protein VKU89_11730 [Solirubrobacteraceae bacterium]|nr:hypothetical protein [Solirubrobacteraceae bacterium]